MNKVLVIGATNISEVIQIKDSLSADKIFPCTNRTFLTGGQYTVAYNLTVLKVDTYFITRLSYDETANNLMLKFDKNNGMLYSNARQLLSQIPKKTYLFAKDSLTVFENNIYDSFPALEDGLPSEYFVNTDYAIVNIINSNYFSALLRYYPDIHYICNNCIPAEEFLPKMDGIILDIDYANKLVKNQDYDLLASEILAKKVKFLIITNKGEGIYFYTLQNQDYLPKEKVGNYFLGTHEAFVSMFVATLANGMPISTALTYGLNLSNDLSFVEDIELKNEFFKD